MNNVDNHGFILISVLFSTRVPKIGPWWWWGGGRSFRVQLKCSAFFTRNTTGTEVHGRTASSVMTAVTRSAGVTSYLLDVETANAKIFTTRRDSQRGRRSYRRFSRKSLFLSRQLAMDDDDEETRSSGSPVDRVKKKTLKKTIPPPPKRFLLMMTECLTAADPYRVR